MIFKFYQEFKNRIMFIEFQGLENVVQYIQLINDNELYKFTFESVFTLKFKENSICFKNLFIYVEKHGEKLEIKAIPSDKDCICYNDKDIFTCDHSTIFSFLVQLRENYTKHNHVNYTGVCLTYIEPFIYQIFTEIGRICTIIDSGIKEKDNIYSILEKIKKQKEKGFLKKMIPFAGLDKHTLPNTFNSHERTEIKALSIVALSQGYMNLEEYIINNTSNA